MKTPLSSLKPLFLFLIVLTSVPSVSFAGRASGVGQFLLDHHSADFQGAQDTFLSLRTDIQDKVSCWLRSKGQAGLLAALSGAEDYGCDGEADGDYAASSPDSSSSSGSESPNSVGDGDSEGSGFENNSAVVPETCIRKIFRPGENAWTDAQLQNVKAGLYESIDLSGTRSKDDDGAVTWDRRKLSAEQWDAVLSSLTSNRCMNVLLLAGTQLDNADITDLLTQLSNNRLKVLSLAGIIEYRNSKTTSHSKTLARAVRGMLELNQDLLSLDLSENQIGFRGAQNVLLGLQKNSSLRWLDLSYNKLGYWPLSRVIGETLKKNTGLQYLGLRHLRVSRKHVKRLSKGIQPGIHPRFIDLREIIVSQQVSETLSTQSVSENIAGVSAKRYAGGGRRSEVYGGKVSAPKRKNLRSGNADKTPGSGALEESPARSRQKRVKPPRKGF